MPKNINQTFNLLQRSRSSSFIYPPFIFPSGNNNVICFFCSKDGMFTDACIYTMDLEYVMSVSVSIHFKAHTGILNGNIREKLNEEFTGVIETAIMEPDSLPDIYSHYLMTVSDIEGMTDFVKCCAAANPSLMTSECMISLFGNSNADVSVNKQIVSSNIQYFVKKIFFRYDKKDQKPTPLPAAKPKHVPRDIPANEAFPSKNVPSDNDHFTNMTDGVPQSAAKPVTVYPPVPETRPNIKTADSNANAVKPGNGITGSAIEKPDNNPKNKPQIPGNPKPLPIHRGTSVIESAIPRLKAFNTGIIQLKGKGFFHSICFVGGDAYFAACAEKEAELLYNAGILKSPLNHTFPQSGDTVPDNAYIATGISAEQAKEALLNQAFLFFCGKAPDGIRCNIFDISGAGVVSVEEDFLNAGVTVKCDLNSVLSAYPSWYYVDRDVLVNQTLLEHFSRSGSLDITKDDFQWLETYTDAETVGKTDESINEEPSPDVNNSIVTENTASEDVISSLIGNISSPDVSQPVPYGSILISDPGFGKPNDDKQTIASAYAEDIPETESKTAAVPDSIPVGNDTPAERFCTGSDFETRKSNAAIAEEINLLNTDTMRAIKATHNNYYDAILSEYIKAVDSKDYKFLGATRCRSLYDRNKAAYSDVNIYKTSIYNRIYKSEEAVREKLEKIIPVTRSVTCFCCRHKWNEDVSIITEASKSTNCPSCAHSIIVEI